MKGTKVVVKVEGVEVGKRTTKRPEGYPFAVVRRMTPAAFHSAAARYRGEAESARRQAAKYRRIAAMPSGHVYEIYNGTQRAAVIDDNDPRIEERGTYYFCRVGDTTYTKRSDFTRYAEGDDARAIKADADAVSLDGQGDAGEFGEWGVACYCGRRDLAEKAAAGAAIYAGQEVRVVATEIVK